MTIPAQTKKITARIINKKEVPGTTRGPAGGLRETAPIFPAREFTETGAKSTGKAATERSFFCEVRTRFDKSNEEKSITPVCHGIKKTVSVYSKPMCSKTTR